MATQNSFMNPVALVYDNDGKLRTPAGEQVALLRSGVLETQGPLWNRISQDRIQRKSAWASGPIVVPAARQNSTAYTAAAANVTAAASIFQRADGNHCMVTGSGNSAAAEPTGLIDGRPLVDGTATVYALGWDKPVSDPDAPTITEGATSGDITTAGLTLFDFVTAANPPVAVSTADAMIYNRSNGAFVDCVQHANGVPPATGNSGVTSASWKPVDLPAAGYAYNTNMVDYDVWVEDRIFAIVGGSFGWTGYILIDGKPLSSNYLTSGGASGSGVIIDFGGISKRRRVTFGNYAAAGVNIAGIAITAQGKVTAVERTGDTMLVLGDSYNSTVAPNSAPHLGFFLKRYLGLDGLVLANVGGSGYINKVVNTFNIPEVLSAGPNQLLWPYYNPKHVLINAGGNDGSFSSASIQEAALQTWRNLRTIFPTAKVTITDGNSGAAGPGANNFAVAAALRTAFDTWADSNSRFVPIIGASATESWITGTSHAGQALAAGNSSLWTSTDGTHPSPGGARYLARRLADSIDAAWNGGY